MIIKAIDKGTSRGGANESAKTRVARMQQWFGGNRILIAIGRILSLEMAQALIDGETITGIESIDVAGHQLPVAEGYEISMATAANWLCPACASAHGYGGYPSKPDSITAKNLASNEWYYDVRTRTLVTISKTCRETYVDGLGFQSQVWTPLDYAMSLNTPAKKSRKALGAVAETESA